MNNYKVALIYIRKGITITQIGAVHQFVRTNLKILQFDSLANQDLI